MTEQVSRGSGWSFSKVADGWMWRCLDPRTGAVILQSSRRFRSLLECIKDAERHGYAESRDTCEAQEVSDSAGETQGDEPQGSSTAH